ncbi:MAG: hypothetical protein ABIH48_01030 [Candidatus Falkowbacteria bacterium]
MRTEQGKSAFGIYIPLGFILYLAIYFTVLLMYPLVWLGIIIFSLVSFGFIIKISKRIQTKNSNQSSAKL